MDVAMLYAPIGNAAAPGGIVHHADQAVLENPKSYREAVMLHKQRHLWVQR